MSTDRSSYTLSTSRLQLAPLAPDDAEDLERIVRASLDDLARWLPWARHEPVSLQARRELLGGFYRAFVEGREYTYGVRRRSDGALVGAVGLHPRASRLPELGYWLATAETGKGYAREAVAAVVDAALSIHGMDAVEIRHEPRNHRSGRVAEGLGFRPVGVVATGVNARGEKCDLMVWRLTADAPDPEET